MEMFNEKEIYIDSTIHNAVAGEQENQIRIAPKCTLAAVGRPNCFFQISSN
jgi:hypothetical protein